MDQILYYVCLPFGYILKGCQTLVGNYGVAILLFAFLTKLLLFPLSVWIQKNSIQMVKIQPEVNFLKARLWGNNEAIADETSKLYKREKYHPMLSLIPLLLQIVLLLIVVDIIYNPITYLFGTDVAVAQEFGNFLNINMQESGWQIVVINAIKNGQITSATAVGNLSPAVVGEVVAKAQALNMSFLGFNLSVVPAVAWGVYILVPLLAGASSWVLCFTQNKANVIQAEQSKWNQYGLMIFSVVLSLYLGLFVPAGIAYYWILGNLFSVAQMYLLNVMINPKKYVDYEQLESSRKALAEAKAFGAEEKTEKTRENKKREKADYKRFKNVANKHIVFYSEKSGFYKYYQSIIEHLLKKSNIIIHYVTNDPDDAIFEKTKTGPRIKAYYISLKKTSILMMMLSADMFVMSTPDLDKYYLKRSFMRKDIEYIYVPHDMMSVHMSFREGAFDAFDTIFCTGPHTVKELREIEKVYNLPSKNLVEFGYPLADFLDEAGKKAKETKEQSVVKEILIAPSWQEDNLLDSCVDTLIEKLLCDKRHITVRPHPEYVKRYGAQLNQLVERYKGYDEKQLSFELDFSVNKSLYTADVLITDWSGVAPEFCFATKRPAIFVNTQMKCCNPNWKKISSTPVEITLRDEIGVSVNKEDLEGISNVVDGLLDNAGAYEKVIQEKFDSFLFNHNKAGEAGATYILNALVKMAKEKKEKENK